MKRAAAFAAIPPARHEDAVENKPMNTPPDATLAALRQEFPGYRVWLEPAHDRYRFVARRLHPGTGPHTVITSDPAELRAALAGSGQPQPGPALPRRGGFPGAPPDRQAGESADPRGAPGRPT
jgi:hypothetical protein